MAGSYCGRRLAGERICLESGRGDSDRDDGRPFTAPMGDAGANREKAPE